jgi:hypothetical protein
MEVHKKRVQLLEQHNTELEKRIGRFQDQQTLYKLMLGDIENYKKYEQFSKEHSTYFSPFTKISEATLS